ncbi:MAG: hypothetical protein WBC93_16735 [Sulfitobacter sp.]
MREVLLGIWQNAPVWIWPLFFILLLIGFLAMRTRNSSIIPYFFYPLFGLSAANAISGLVHVPTSWTVFAVSYLVGVALAFRWQDGLILQKTGWTMRLKGDRITILILMLIFFSNFVNGVVEAVAPQMREMTVFTAIFASVIGMCSGSFTGRALRVITLRGRSASA